MRSYQKKVLVIDDEAAVRDNVCRFLELEGYRAVGIADGLKGIAEALRAPPDLVLCDLMMPGIDGFGVLARLRAEPVTAEIPFIFLTASAVPEDATTGFKLGANEYITKPFSLAVLRTVIAQRLGLEPESGGAVVSE